jgi:hypothetical protein
VHLGLSFLPSSPAQSSNHLLQTPGDGLAAMHHRAPLPPRLADLPRAPAAAAVPRRARCRRRGGRRSGQGLTHPDWDAWEVIEFDPFCGFFVWDDDEFVVMLVKIVSLGSVNC